MQFFFKRVKFNKTGRFEQYFPYLSLCGRERNFIRCDDLPIVYTTTHKADGKLIMHLSIFNNQKKSNSQFIDIDFF